MLSRACLVLIALAANVRAGEYEDIVSEALRIGQEFQAGEPPDRPLDRAYDKLAEACKLAPARWEAFFRRGLNRCQQAINCREMLVLRLNTMLVRGADVPARQAIEARGLEYIQNLIDQARQDFKAMALRTRDENLARFALACVEFARGDYLPGSGGPGAVALFEELHRLDWNQELCANLLAQCYMQLGAVALVRHEDSLKAQEFWDEGLKWARTIRLKQQLLTNKAGAYESAGEYDRAKVVLREQIDLTPPDPVHWKNLGLLLGYEGKVREALHAYGKARQLCEQADTPFFFGLLHGSAWTKAAMIHGTLLPDDGDMLTAWQLFLEYRQMFGDDYNFCLDFGRFLKHHHQFELAWVFLTRARDLQPFCRMPYLILLSIAPRLQGTPEEVEKKVEEANAAYEKVRENESASPSIKRMCSGLVDRSDSGITAGRNELLSPDPLAGAVADKPPQWALDVAKTRQPFQPFDPWAVEEKPGKKTEHQEVAGKPETSPGRGFSPLPWVAGALGLLAVAAVFFRLRARG